MTEMESGRMDEQSLDFVALVRVTWRYKYLIGLVTFASGLIAVFLALTATSVYRAEVVVAEVSASNMSSMAGLANQLGPVAGLIGLNLGSSSGPNRQAQGLLNSRYLVEEFVTRHGGMPELSAKAAKKPTLWQTVRQFRGSLLSIREDRRTGLTVVSITWSDAAVAASWANEFIALANELLRDRAMKESRASIEYLNEQIGTTNVVELHRVLYGLIENETKTLMLANVRAEYAFTVVDPAVAPEQRFRPRRRLMVMIGLALGGLLGCLLAFGHYSWAEFRWLQRNVKR